MGKLNQVEDGQTEADISLSVHCEPGEKMTTEAQSEYSSFLFTFQIDSILFPDGITTFINLSDFQN